MASKNAFYQGSNEVFMDERGYFFESYKQNKLKLLPKFVQDNVSVSKAGVLRGLHAQKKHPQGKLVTVLSGRIFDVAVNLRTGSVHKFWLNAGQQIYVPKGCLHGFYCPIPSIVHYKCTDYYHKGDEIGVRWDDPDLNIGWPVKRPIISDKDKNWPLFRGLECAM